MWKQSVWSTTIASSLAAKHLQDGGLLTLPGAFAATEGTSGIFYWVASENIAWAISNTVAKH